MFKRDRDVSRSWSGPARSTSSTTQPQVHGAAKIYTQQPQCTHNSRNVPEHSPNVHTPQPQRTHNAAAMYTQCSHNVHDVQSNCSLCEHTNECPSGAPLVHTQRLLYAHTVVHVSPPWPAQLVEPNSMFRTSRRRLFLPCFDELNLHSRCATFRITMLCLHSRCACI